MHKVIENKHKKITPKTTGKCREEEEDEIQTLENNAHTAIK